MILLSADDVRGLLEPAAILEVVEDALRMERAGQVRWAVPENLRVPGAAGQGRLRVKACSLDGPGGVSGVRVLHFPAGGNDARWILLFDAISGEPLAIVDESATYGDRSFASLALLAHGLRAEPVDAVAILGAGRIARAALPYVADRFPGAAIAIAARREAAAAELVELAAARYGIGAAAASFEEAVRGSRVVFGCTSASEPIVLDAWVGPGTVVASLEPRECDPALYRHADLRIADRPVALREELEEAFGASAADRIDATMAEVVDGAHPGRTSPRDRVVVLSQGLVSQDILLAHRIVGEALSRGVGAVVAAPWVGAST